MDPIKIQASPSGLIILRLTIASKVIAPIVIQPSLGNWVRKDGKIFLFEDGIEPAYSFLQTGGESRSILTIKISEDAIIGDQLYGMLTIPCSEQYNFPIHLKIINSPATGTVHDFSANLEIPPASSKKEDKEINNYLVSKSTLKLMTGLASLEVIPSKWLVSELVLSCCKVGYEYAITEDGSEFLTKISKTRLYKNGILIFQGAQIVQWLKLTLSISKGINSFTGSQKGEILLLQSWEEWLLNLVNQDVESPAFQDQKIELPPQTGHEKVLDNMGMDASKWFGYFLLGLSKFSKRIQVVLIQLVEKIELEKSENNMQSISTPSNVLNEKGSLQR